MPLPRDHTEERRMRHRRGNGPRKRRRIVTIGAAIIAVAAIAIGIILLTSPRSPPVRCRSICRPHRIRT